MGSNNHFLVLIVYVDGVLIAGAHELDIINVKHFLDKKFTINYLRYVNYFLKLEIARSSVSTFLSQRKYVLDTIKDVRLMQAKIVDFLMPKVLKLNTNDDWAACPMSWKSIMGFCIFLRSSLVSLKSKK
ncbi:uncharacterized mitochondrial protein AtMg00810-like [Hevea brasiliensis]|uniref:uncharacterized mitochondrial protein AtMg00810-like n=1 Tax=Hevea brasiliensis TaxID=3981 RepID=UPI0025D61242|nr:uncharacterized mitochondrial protein AtMg00810-like [Hevea brasiliensis]